MPEDAGGFGLSLADVAPLLFALGAYAVPLPVGETMMARALVARSGALAPDGPGLLLDGPAHWPVPSARGARWALVTLDAGMAIAQIEGTAPPVSIPISLPVLMWRPTRSLWGLCLRTRWPPVSPFCVPR